MGIRCALGISLKSQGYFNAFVLEAVQGYYSATIFQPRFDATGPDL
ncbi:hypothetical protein VSH64_21400 [Amycolatopsis rhabdoformis]|uniref:Uncharacterized protein n=1 Tax=Amycolatopsis rhabdoformis TaxID=1448059 RepID=A0ABZ1IJL9_9PSEU|nr:hypothetical protein [Amycolatopsis rhabdoformis]WSE34606.1 hypothetical protein VSH64_21400 [Amycolatopsis rhabdoformis]